MGCDIHMYREKLVNGRWVTGDTGWETDAHDDGTTYPYLSYRHRCYTDRNYEMFGVLSKGVRSEHTFSFQPRGLPLNPCEEVKGRSDALGEDGHNHSYLYLHEMRELAEFLKTATVRISGMKSPEELASLRASIDSGSPDWNLLYPYCQWTSDRTAEKFAFDVPASFIVGEGLERIVAAFDGMDGDNHRVIFWFDN
jgi:hypothetical protein